jgi:di/tricarboxylate transporter
VKNDFPEDRQVLELWQNQKTEGVRMSVEQVRLEAGRFGRKIGARNLREYVVAVVMMIYFGFWFSRIPYVAAKVGFGLLIAGLAYLVWHMLSKGSPGTMDETAGLSGWIEFRRRELVRQRDLLRSVWKWYLGPCVPGLVVLVVWFVLANRSKPIVVLGAAVYALVVAAGFWWMARLNAKGADKLQRQIDELDELRGG